MAIPFPAIHNQQRNPTPYNIQRLLILYLFAHHFGLYPSLLFRSPFGFVLKALSRCNSTLGSKGDLIGPRIRPK
jgi:hypothetical protein